MLQGLGSLFEWPWIYLLVALSVLLDVFVPVLPSGVLVISAATAGSTGTDGGVLDILALLAVRRRRFLPGRPAGVPAGLARRRVVRAPAGELAPAGGRARAARPGAGGRRRPLVVLARFAPAGRSVVSLGAGAARRRPREFLPWSALAGVCWATYSVGLGWIGGKWLGESWFGTLMSLVALMGAGVFAAYVFRRERRSAVAAAASAAAAAAYAAMAITIPPQGAQPERGTVVEAL